MCIYGDAQNREITEEESYTCDYIYTKETFRTYAK